MEYSLDLFVNRLRELMYQQFPFEDESENLKRHRNRPDHIRDVAFARNQTVYIDDNQRMFDIGNANAEEKYPYYHILENAPFIRKRGKGTDKTRGSQAKVEKLSARDYEIVSFNGKSYTKEYSRNVRGKRAELTRFNADRHITIGGQEYRINRSANYYENIHYQYIENMLNSNIVDTLAAEFSMKRGRTQSTGLEEEYKMQEEDIMAILDSFR